MSDTGAADGGFFDDSSSFETERINPYYWRFEVDAD